MAITDAGTTGLSTEPLLRAAAACEAGPTPPPARGSYTDCNGGLVLDLATLSSPHIGDTRNMGNTYTLSCGGQGNEAMFSTQLQPGQEIDIGQTSNTWDSRHETSWGGICPGQNIVRCTDDPDTMRHHWTNDQSSPQNVFFVVDSYSGGQGEFNLTWTVACGSAGYSGAPVNDGPDGCVSTPCEHCHGDCDSDAECSDGMTCFMRDSGGDVPGCPGAPTGIHDDGQMDVSLQTGIFAVSDFDEWLSLNLLPNAVLHQGHGCHSGQVFRHMPCTQLWHPVLHLRQRWWVRLEWVQRLRGKRCVRHWTSERWHFWLLLFKSLRTMPWVTAQPLIPHLCRFLPSHLDLTPKFAIFRDCDSDSECASGMTCFERNR